MRAIASAVIAAIIIGALYFGREVFVPSLRILLPDRSSRRVALIAASHSVNRRHSKPHHIADLEQVDVAVSSSENFRSQASSEEVQGISRGDGRPSISDSGQAR
jgi:hypothetical protein